jgi:hypothetical protein
MDTSQVSPRCECGECQEQRQSATSESIAKWLFIVLFVATWGGACFVIGLAQGLRDCAGK